MTLGRFQSIRGCASSQPKSSSRYCQRVDINSTADMTKGASGERSERENLGGELWGELQTRGELKGLMLCYCC